MCYFLWLEGHSLFTSFAGAKKKKKKLKKGRIKHRKNHSRQIMGGQNEDSLLKKVEKIIKLLFHDNK